jgi:hypothetical protein
MDREKRDLKLVESILEYELGTFLVYRFTISPAFMKERKKKNACCFFLEQE